MSSKKRNLSTEAGKVSPPTKRKAVQSSVTEASVSNFFKPLSQKEPEKTGWRVVDGLLLVGKYTRHLNDEQNRSTGRIVRKKIAGFDLDSTLIVTQSGNRHAKNETDWKWWHESVPKKLRKLNEEGYKVVIFTNQGGLKDPRKNSPIVVKFKNKVTAILNALDIPLSIYAATGHDIYRKPRVGMWEIMKDDYDLDAHGVELDKSYLVGDAAGREGDFSDSDRHWAMNIGINFHTPEEFFLKEAPRPMIHQFDPSSVITTSVTKSELRFSKPDHPELVLMVGSPGSGKSSLFARHLKPLGYDRVNQDTLKSRDKCLKVAAELLVAGRSVVVDNTNADRATRNVWLSLAQKHNLPIRCIYLTASVELCQHNDAVRAFGGELVNPENRKLLPKVAFTRYSSRFEEPKESEGFQSLTKVDFQWEGSSQQLEIWQKYWT